MMKRIIALLLTFAFVFLCGCSKEISESETKSTTEKTTLVTDFTKVEIFTTDSFSTSESDKELFIYKEKNIDTSDPYAVFLNNWYKQYYQEWVDFSKSRGNSTMSLYTFSKACTEYFYSFYDLDRDGKDELLLGGLRKCGKWTEEPEVPVKLVITNVCTIKNGEVVKLDKYGLFINLEYIRDCYLLSNGKIVTTWGYKDSPNYFIVDYENNELVSKCYIERDKDDSFINLVDFEPFRSVPITNEQYKSIFNELCGDAKPVDINWKRIDEYGM